MIIPVAEVLEQASAQVRSLLSRILGAFSDEDLVDMVRQGVVLVSQWQAVVALAAHELGGRGWPKRCGSATLATWLRDDARVSIYTARRLVELGDLMGQRPALADAVTGGSVMAEQAAVIGKAVASMARDVPSNVVDACETTLVDYAGEFDPGRLGALVDRALAHVAPEIADRAAESKLAREERRAAETRSLTIVPDGPARMRISGYLPVEAATVIADVLDPLSKPCPGPTGERDPRTPEQRRADALADVFRLHLAGVDLPSQGGRRPRLTVTVDYDVLSQQLGVGTLDTGMTLSPDVVRQLACDAEILPAVMRGDGAVLDVGRSRRLFSGRLRRAIVLRDHGCAFPTCDRKPKWCQAHHIVSWFSEGPTSLANAVLLCGFHHRVIHEPDGWQVRMAADGLPEFIPPRYLDPLQVPRRNTPHRC